MNSGLLYYDNAQKPALEKITDAARRYTEKFGIMPDTCFLNPDDVPESPNGERTVTLILIEVGENTHVMSAATKSTILRNHIWLGMSNSQPANVQPPSL